jgi:hypothetical protein
MCPPFKENALESQADKTIVIQHCPVRFLHTIKSHLISVYYILIFCCISAKIKPCIFFKITTN